VKTLAFIVKDGEIKAIVSTDLKNGCVVEYSHFRSKEAINADREYNLVNARKGKISRAKKYMQYRLQCSSIHGEEINPGEFYIESLYQDED